MTYDPLNVFIALAIVVAFLRGVRASRSLRRVFLDDTRVPRSTILRAFRNIALIVTAAAGWFGFLLLRAVAGFQPLPPEISRPIGAVIAVVVLLIPDYLWRILKEIRQRPPVQPVV